MKREKRKKVREEQEKNTNIRNFYKKRIKKDNKKNTEYRYFGW